MFLKLQIANVVKCFFNNVVNDNLRELLLFLIEKRYSTLYRRFGNQEYQQFYHDTKYVKALKKTSIQN